MKRSTKQIIKLHGWRLDRAIHYYIYFRFYDLYVKIALYATKAIVALFSGFELTGAIGKFIFDRYHAKIVSRGDVTNILELGEGIDLGPDTTGRIVPFKYANNLVLKEPEHIAVMDCACKLALNAPCTPVNCCIAVGQPVVDFWMEHCEKFHARRISKEEALDIIRELRSTGHINQVFFKVATGGSMSLICNCCPKCCVSMQATQLVQHIKGAGDLSQSVASGYKVRHDEDKCELCGDCAAVCHFSAIDVKDGQWIYHEHACMGCELCVERCPHGALSLVYEGGDLIPLDMDMVKGELGR
jgi:ferredoxin